MTVEAPITRLELLSNKQMLESARDILERAERLGDSLLAYNSESDCIILAPGSRELRHEMTAEDQTRVRYEISFPSTGGIDEWDFVHLAKVIYKGHNPAGDKEARRIVAYGGHSVSHGTEGNPDGEVSDGNQKYKLGVGRNAQSIAEHILGHFTRKLDQLVAANPERLRGLVSEIIDFEVQPAPEATQTV